MPVILMKKKILPAPPSPPEQPGEVINYPAAAALPNVELSEDAIAEAFALTYLDTLRFDHTRRKWSSGTGRDGGGTTPNLLSIMRVIYAVNIGKTSFEWHRGRRLRASS